MLVVSEFFIDIRRRFIFIYCLGEEVFGFFCLDGFIGDLFIIIFNLNH